MLDINIIDIFKINYHICYFGPNIEQLHTNALCYVTYGKILSFNKISQWLAK